MRVLIAFGSKCGGTAGLADMIGDALREAGFETVVSPATGIYDLTDFDAVVVVGALYANRWHRDARRFVRSDESEPPVRRCIPRPSERTGGRSRARA